jgi:hypothetical protein
VDADKICAIYQMNCYLSIETAAVIHLDTLSTGRDRQLLFEYASDESNVVQAFANVHCIPNTGVIRYSKRLALLRTLAAAASMKDNGNELVVVGDTILLDPKLLLPKISPIHKVNAIKAEGVIYKAFGLYLLGMTKRAKKLMRAHQHLLSPNGQELQSIFTKEYFPGVVI